FSSRRRHTRLVSDWSSDVCSSDLSLALATIGLYGVMSYAVSQSTRELGLRMALGAGAAELLRLVVSRGLRLTASGLLLGFGAARSEERRVGKGGRCWGGPVDVRKK